MTDKSQKPELEILRMRYAFWLAVTGLGLSAALVIILFIWGMDSSQIGAIVGIFTGLTGTLVGTFFGVQIGSIGREQERQEKQKMETMAMMAIGELEPEKAKAIMDEMNPGYKAG